MRSSKEIEELNHKIRLLLKDLIVTNGVESCFPICCCVEFAERVEDKMMYKGKGPADCYDGPLSGTGFIPCETCAKHNQPKQMLKEINKKRRESGLDPLYMTA